MTAAVRPFKRTFVGVFSLLLFSSVVHAQAVPQPGGAVPDPNNKPVKAITETVIVSAALVDQPLSRTPDSVTVISGRELESRQQFTLRRRCCVPCPA